jgi:putative tryptophan/tyrosine transport system substrate-binding protein
MRRREFIAALGGAAAWPLVARAQQPAPVVGFLSSLSSNYIARMSPAVRQGLGETGYVEGQNVAIEYRLAEGQYDRLPSLVTELVSRKVSVILAAGGSDPAKLAKAATKTIPIVFISAADPINAGLVASFSRPEGNVTGVSLIGSALEAKRLELMWQLVPGASLVGVLVNQKYPDADLQVREAQEAAEAKKRQIEIVRASTESETEMAFATLAQRGADALVVAQDVFFNSRRQLLVTLAARNKLPTIYNQREYPEIGGLISYGTHFLDGYRQAGVYVGKILKGASPHDLPILQPTRFDFVINLKTANDLGLEIPPQLLARADEVIE